jgi:L-fuconate dehydratase
VPYSNAVAIQVCFAIDQVAKRLVGKDAEELFGDMGKTWDWLMADSQLRWYV